MNIFFSIFLIFFWSAIFSFVPAVMYLIINPLESIISEKLRMKGIYVIRKEIELDGEKKRRIRGVCIIYSICFALTVCLSVFNWMRFGEAARVPIDILSTMSVVLFCFAALTFLPIMLCLIFITPWRYKKEGVYLRWTFVGYGVCIMLFSVFYAYHWLKNKGILVDPWDLISPLFICIFGAACLSYLPILGYVLVKSSKPVVMGMRPSVIFVIFGISFLLFSGIFVQEWITDRTAVVKSIPLSF